MIFALSHQTANLYEVRSTAFTLARTWRSTSHSLTAVSRTYMESSTLSLVWWRPSCWPRWI